MEQKQKKILIIFNRYTPDLSDPNNLFAKLARDLNIKIEIALCLLHERNRPRINFINLQNENYKLLKLKGFTFGIDKHFNLGIIPLILFNNYSLIIIGGYSFPTVILAILLCKLFRKRWVLLIDGLSLENPIKNIKYILKLLLIRNAAGYLVPDEYHKNYINQNYKIDKNKIFCTYPTTSDLNLFLVKYNDFQKIKIRQSLNIPKEAIVILYVGRLIKEKGVEELLSAYLNIVRELKRKDIYLVYIGYGSLFTKIQQECKKQKIENVRMLYNIPHKKLPIYYQSADIFVSFSYGDIWGYTIVEAVASGLPVITTNKVNSANNFVFDNINGYKITAGDVNALEASLKKLIESKELKKQFSMNSDKIIQNNPEERTYSNYLKAINNLLLEN
jgi:glycosyltransferase involved in cell wall biosynthesis